MSTTIDNAIALRILWILITPFNQTDAFKYGIIDAEGKPIKKAKTLAEKESYSMLHRLVFRLKRVLGVLPFGKTNFASYVAAYQLVKESVDSESEDEHLEELFISLLNQTQFNDISEAELKKLFDDVSPGTVTTAAVAGYDKPLKFQKVASRTTFKNIKKQKNTLYKINEDYHYEN